MVSSTIVILIIFVIIALVALGVWIFIIRRDATDPMSPNNILDPFECVPVDQLIDISNLQCCVQGSSVSPLRYVESLDAIVGPSAVFWAQACAGHCERGIRTTDNTACVTGDSTAYQQCANLIKPTDTCGELALPVAILGADRYYIVEISNANCQTTTPCG